jgi:hypothetical protein
MYRCCWPPGEQRRSLHPSALATSSTAAFRYSPPGSELRGIPGAEDRQRKISGFDQEIFSRSRVICVGAGGIISHIAPTLGRKGIGSIMLIDDDIVEPSNAQGSAAQRNRCTQARDCAARTPGGPRAARCTDRSRPSRREMPATGSLVTSASGERPSSVPRLRLKRPKKSLSDVPAMINLPQPVAIRRMLLIAGRSLMAERITLGLFSFC